ncbi:MAG: hypothetical protein IPO91_34480 [Chloroflexi bacterium]|nr:hypothetical protein [Chloroflexota bacterium]MBK9751846.1 hypothetical protein [Chloroflexota bacterium]
MAKVTKTELRKALEAHGGVIAKVADAYQVTRQTVYNWIDTYHLREMVEASRVLMFDMAADNVFVAVEKGDFEASKFVLTHMPTPKRWSNRQELTGANGMPLGGLPQDVLEYMGKVGITPDVFMNQFVEMMRAEMGGGQ